jgi:hypothetical protein
MKDPFGQPKRDCCDVVWCARGIGLVVQHCPYSSQTAIISSRQKKEGRRGVCQNVIIPQTQEKGSERSERGAVSRLWHDRPPFLFLFFLFFLSRACACFSFFFCRPSLYIKGEYTWASVCRWWAHTIYCMYTWEFDFVRPNCPPISYSRPPSSAFLGREIKGFHRSFSRLKPNLTLWKDDGVGFVNHASFGIDGTAHKFAPPAANFQTFQITSRASLWYYVTVKVRPVSLFIPSIDY